MKFFNVHAGTDNSEADRFDTLISPASVVATLNQITEQEGLDTIGFDEAYPNSQRIRVEIRNEIEKCLSAGIKPVIQNSLLVYNAESSLDFIAELKKDFRDRIITVVGGQLVPFATSAYKKNPNIDVTCVGDGEVIIPQLASDIKNGITKPFYSS